MKVQAIAEQIRDVLRDADQDSWNDDDIYAAILEGERVITNYRWEASATDYKYTCVAGVRQSLSDLPAPALQANGLLSVKYNVATGVPGRGVRRTAIGDMDSLRPNWRSDTAADTVKNYFFDDREPLLFYVWPPASANAVLQISYSAIPPDYGVVDGTTATTVSDMYAPMIVEWALYRLFGHDVVGSANYGRSQQHLQVFGNMMGIKIQAEKIAGPKNPEHKR